MCEKKRIITTSSSERLARVPEVGERIKFFDDGKTGYNRRYWATVLEIIPAEIVKTDNHKLYKGWKTAAKDCYWLYAKETDFFIKADVEEYDEDPCYFVRTIQGDWFSIDYPHDWMGGLLDIDDRRWNEVKIYYETETFLNVNDKRYRPWDEKEN